MKRTRRNFTAKEKVGMIRMHLIEKAPISDICDQFDIQATQFYQWQKMFFENGELAFSKADKKQKDKTQQNLNKKISQLEEKITHKDGVIAEIVESNINLKKNLGLD